MLVLIFAAAVMLAFANGANDNAKGVATLIGSGTTSHKSAIRFAAVATLLGSVASIWFAQELLARFSGKGLVDSDLAGTPAFLAGVALAAGITVLFATRLGLPISTTHALVGGIAGVGLSAGALHSVNLIRVFLVPLLIAPGLALLLSAPLSLGGRRLRLRLGITRDTCVCIDQRYEPVSLTADGAMLLQATGVKLGGGDGECAISDRYGGRLLGVDAQHVVDWLHILSAGAISFARGLNDTPKIAALLLVAGMFEPQIGLVAIGIGIATGGLLATRRVAETMSHRITEMNDGRAFSANLVTALLVIVASRFGVPVSTTHVSCGSLFGIGLASGEGHWYVIRRILAAWVITLPAAGCLGWLAWQLLAAI